MHGKISVVLLAKSVVGFFCSIMICWCLGYIIYNFHGIIKKSAGGLVRGRKCRMEAEWPDGEVRVCTS